MKKFFMVFCIFLTGIALALNSGATFVVAKEKPETSLAWIERKLQDLDTDVISELEKQKADFETRLQGETDEENIARLENLIVATERLMESCNKPFSVREEKPAAFAVKTEFSSWEMMERNADLTYIPKDTDVFFYENAVSAIVAYFYAHKYYLAAELLTHARYNRTYASIYTPVNIEALEFSSAYTSVCENEEFYGWSEFVKSGSVQDKDLFYAIHYFRYAKFQEGNVVTIYDNYDFVFDGQNDFIDDLPIKVMYMAQERGVIVPFNVVIEKRLNGDESIRVNENYPQISYVDGEYHIYKTGCACDCLANHIEGDRVGESHVDSDENRVCDLCAQTLSVESPLPEQQPEQQPEQSPEQPLKEKDDFEEFMNGVKETFNDVKDNVTGFFEKDVAGCSGSLSVSVGGVSAIGFCVFLFLKKKE